MNEDTVDAGQSSLELDDTDIPGTHLDENSMLITSRLLYVGGYTVLQHENPNFFANSSDYREVKLRLHTVHVIP